MKNIRYSTRKAMYGRAFISIWALGVLLFFIVPFVQTIVYSLCKVTTDNNGIVLTPVGMDMYKRIFTLDAEALPKLSTSLLSLLYNVPLIVMFSLLIAVILNHGFPCRTFFRAIFFMPVIVMSGSILLLFKSDNIAMMLFGGTESGQKVFENITLLNDLFTNWGWGEKLILVLESIVSRVLNVCWSSGVQIILCLSALQSIPESLYEASRIEGATKWEEFWKITFPMSTPVLFVCVIYTIVKEGGGSFMQYAKYVSFTSMDYGYGSALSVFFCVVIVLVIGMVSFVLRGWNRNAIR